MAGTYARIVGWSVVFWVFVFVLAVTLLAAEAAGPAYCALWAREATRIELMSAGDIDTRTLSEGGIERRMTRHYSRCMLTESEHIALPRTHATTTAGWLEDMRTLSLQRAGVFPGEANGNAYPSRSWEDACAAEYRSWDEEKRDRRQGGDGARQMSLRDRGLVLKKEPNGRDRNVHWNVPPWR